MATVQRPGPRAVRRPAPPADRSDGPQDRDATTSGSLLVLEALNVDRLRAVEGHQDPEGVRQPEPALREPDRPGPVGPHHRFGTCQRQLRKIQPAQFLGCEPEVPLPEPGPAVPHGSVDENVETAHNVESESEGDLFGRRGRLDHQTDNRRVAGRRLREAAGPAGQGRRALRPFQRKPTDTQRCRQVHISVRGTRNSAVVRHRCSICEAPSRRSARQPGRTAVHGHRDVALHHFG
ncbi:hypothetical protein KPATCC21470_8626 [Kitasatospora purpeofusca]